MSIGNDVHNQKESGKGTPCLKPEVEGTLTRVVLLIFVVFWSREVASTVFCTKIPGIMHGVQGNGKRYPRSHESRNFLPCAGLHGGLMKIQTDIVRVLLAGY